MNAHASAHEIPGVRNLYIDAFSGRYLAVAAARPAAAFVLTHYHGDHYGGLPRDGAYRGPARIHCTPLTARVLREVHGVPPELVVAHDYGDTWPVPPPPAAAAASADNHDGGENTTSIARDTRVTFYDAHHCPGAAILVVETPDGAVHVHTGDFRYHPAMRDYPLLREAALARRVDTVWLDTTYAHPRHDFAPQAAAVAAVAARVRAALAGDDVEKTLVLLECYQLGKEKVLQAVADACRRPLYVTEHKARLLACLVASDDEPRHSGDSGDSSENDLDGIDQRHHRLLEVCTQDAAATNLHVVPMGTAARMWPFFQPNYDGIAAYVARHAARDRPCTRAVAVVPTGWAGASAWNRRHATSRVVRRGLTIEVHLVAYSEHSSFAELREFVEFMRPLRLVPTVYKDEKERRQIEARFPVDRTRAKKRFLEQMASTGRTEASFTIEHAAASGTVSPLVTTPTLRDAAPADDRKRAVIEVHDEKKVSQLVVMGFAAADAQRALVVCRQDMEAAIHHLLERANQCGSHSEHLAPSSMTQVKKHSTGTPVKRASPTKLTAFFSRKAKS